MEAPRDQILVVRPGGRRAGPPTPGMDRWEAVATDRMWAGGARTTSGMSSGWHHHGEYESVIFVLTGALRMEFGLQGAHTVDAGPGDLVFVPKGCVHRESNPTEEDADLFVVRAGRGESTFNVDGPDT